MPKDIDLSKIGLIDDALKSLYSKFNNLLEKTDKTITDLQEGFSNMNIDPGKIDEMVQRGDMVKKNAKDIKDIEAMRGTAAESMMNTEFNLDQKLSKIAKERLALKKSGLKPSDDEYKA